MIDCTNMLNKNFSNKRKWKRMYIKEVQNSVAVTCKDTEFGSRQLNNMLVDIVHSIRADVYNKEKGEFFIVIPEFQPIDKMVFILIECVIYTLINTYGYNVHFHIGHFKENINTQGFYYSTLDKMAKEEISKEEFNKLFNFSISLNHFRKVIKIETADEMSPSLLLSEIKTFLARFDIAKEFKDSFAKVISELADNAIEHANADCLIDIDVTDKEFKLVDDEAGGYDYYGINVVVLNLSNLKLGDDISDKIKNKYYDKSERYDIVDEAYKYHSKYFKKTYNEEDFFNITSFQEKISGRKNETKSGGTGLAELIRNLEEHAYENYCYVLSGRCGLMFKKELINFNEDNWVGFNESKNYVSDLPDVNCIFRSDTFLPGTGYNFLFVFKGEKNE